MNNPFRRGESNVSSEKESYLSVSGCTSLDFGCQTCPNKRSVVIPLGPEISLSTIDVPISVVTELNISSQVQADNIFVTIPCDLTLAPLSFNADMCGLADDGSCSVAGEINATADNISKFPGLLDLNLEPQVFTNELDITVRRL